MTNSIRFSSLDVQHGRITVDFEESVDTNSTAGNLYFETTPPITPSNDLIALALSTLCGRQYETVHLDFEISSPTRTAIGQFTGAAVTSGEMSTPGKRSRDDGLLLNFSGGFDSLAAKSLMPEQTKLVSMDFGGRFARERKFFEKFDTCVVKTNLVDTRLRYNSWTFMGIGSILYSEHLGAGYLAFGSILEASANNLSDSPAAARNITPLPFANAGLTYAPYVLGLTEVGTLRVVSRYCPDMVPSSLDSLANPGEEKRYRKQILTQIVGERTGADFSLVRDAPRYKPHFSFGQNFVADFLSFYIIKHAGLGVASETLSEIPDAAVQLAKRLRLDFYERVNPEFLPNFPPELLRGLLDRLVDCGVLPYTYNDWCEFHEVRELLSKHHKVM